MEDTLRAEISVVRNPKNNVLILVLMEDTLRVKHYLLWKRNKLLSLNPCFNGRYSQRTQTLSRESYKDVVLILVLMEDTLRDFDKAAIARFGMS